MRLLSIKCHYLCSISGFDTKVLKRFGLEQPEINLDPLKSFLSAADAVEGAVDIAVVGKYVSLPDAYLSIIEALYHAGVANGVHAEVHLIDGEELNAENVKETLGSMDGILVPGGFGQRAFEGKIEAARYARENNIPFLGICLGLQAAVCEFARNVAGLAGATSAEFDENADYTVIDLMPEQEDVEDKGGTMRLGAYPCKLEKGSLAHEVYGEEVIYERHRHRYEVNNAYRDTLTGAGLRISGLSPDGRLTEMVEIPGHPWFLASQGHPGIQEPTHQAPPAVRGIRWCGLEASRVTSAVFALLLWGSLIYAGPPFLFFSSASSFLRFALSSLSRSSPSFRHRARRGEPHPLD